MMTGNSGKKPVYGSAPLRDLECCDASAVFDWLGLHLPVVGSKIDWSRVSGRHLHWNIADDGEMAATATREVHARILPGSAVEHVGDGLSPYGVRLTNDIARPVVAELLEIPEHHYFLAEDRSWIAVVTTEGDLDIVDQLDF